LEETPLVNQYCDLILELEDGELMSNHFITLTYCKEYRCWVATLMLNGKETIDGKDWSVDAEDGSTQEDSLLSLLQSRKEVWSEYHKSLDKYYAQAQNSYDETAGPSYLDYKEY
jgi:hypothetical protein